MVCPAPSLLLGQKVGLEGVEGFFGSLQRMEVNLGSRYFFCLDNYCVGKIHVLEVCVINALVSGFQDVHEKGW